MDAGTVYNWVRLAMSLSDHPCDVRLRVRAGVAEEGSLDGGLAVWDQPRGKPDFHANPVRIAELAVGCR